jgi:acyl carrier protein
MPNPQDFLSELENTLENCPKGSLAPSTRFRDQPWWDSVAALTLLASFDTVYGKQISIEQLKACATLADVCALG